MSKRLQQWRSYTVSKTQAFWIGAGCVLGTLIIGFTAGGWVTAGEAKSMADRAAGEARSELAVAVCVDQFLEGQDAAAHLAKLKKAVWYDRAVLVREGAWATMPDRKDPNHEVAERCAEKLTNVPWAGAAR